MATETTAFRYVLRYTPVHHPWKRRYNARKEPVPAVVEGRGIWDNETKQWHGEPGTKTDVCWESVRELNGLPAMRSATLAAKLRKAGFRMAKWHASGQVRGWGDWLPGVRIEQWEDGTIRVTDQRGRWDKSTTEQVRERVESYATALQEAGIAIHMADDGLSFTL